MAWLGSLISIVTWLTRIGGIFAALAAISNGQATVVNAQAVGSYSLPDILTTVYTVMAALGLSTTWLVPLKKITEWLKGRDLGFGQTSPAPAPGPLPVPNGGGVSLLSQIPLPDLIAAGDAALTWLSSKLPDKPATFRVTLGGFDFETTIKPVDSAATLPQFDQAADIARKVLELLEKQQAKAATDPAVVPAA